MGAVINDRFIAAFESNTRAVKESTAAAAAAAEKSKISFSAQDGIQIDSAAAAAAAEAKYEPKIKSIQAKIDDAEGTYNVLKDLFHVAQNLSDAMEALSNSGAIATTTATPDSELQPALTATAVSGAAPATHDVEVLQLADKQRYVMRPINKCTSPSAQAVAGANADGIAFVTNGGKFSIYGTSDPLLPINNNGPNNPLNAPVATVTLNNGMSLNDIAAAINAAALATVPAIEITASVVKYDDNRDLHEIVIQSNNIGPDNSFQIVPLAPSLFDHIDSSLKLNGSTSSLVNASSIAILPGGGMKGWSRIAVNTSGLTDDTLLTINGSTLNMAFNAATPPETSLPIIANIINAASAQTGVMAVVKTYNDGGDFDFLVLSSLDGSPINIGFPRNPEGVFCTASSVAYNATAPGSSYNINGINYKAGTNIITNPTSDIASMTLKKVGAGQLNIGDSASWDAKIHNFVESANEAIEFIEKYSQLDENGTPEFPSLFGSANFIAISNLLTSAGSSVSPTALGGIGSLKDIGIEFVNSSKNGITAKYLAINETQFQGIISDPTKSAGVKALFSSYFSATASAGVGLVVNNNPQLTLSSPGEGFNLTGFNILVENLLGDYKITATYQEVKYILDAYELSGNSLSLVGRNGTPFAGLGMIYSADSPLALNEKNKFDNIIFNRGNFVTQNSLLEGYLDANTGIISQAVTKAAAKLADVKSNLSSVESEQKRASEDVRNRITALEMYLAMQDDMQDMIIQMITGKDE